MRSIKCCRDCVPPKRHPGCHSSCKEYRKEREDLDEERHRIKSIKDREDFFYKTKKY